MLYLYIKVLNINIIYSLSGFDDFDEIKLLLSDLY